MLQYLRRKDKKPKMAWVREIVRVVQIALHIEVHGFKFAWSVRPRILALARLELVHRVARSYRNPSRKVLAKINCAEHHSKPTLSSL